MSELLENRIAKCTNCSNTEPSSKKLAHFAYRGVGSTYALDNCALCPWLLSVHDGSSNGSNASAFEEASTHDFESIGASEFDSFYCGCNGWN